MKLTIDTTIIEGTKEEVFEFLEATGIFGQLRKATSFEPTVEEVENDHDVCLLTKGIENPEQFLQKTGLQSIQETSRVNEFDSEDVVTLNTDLLVGLPVGFIHKGAIGIVKSTEYDIFDRLIYDVVFVQDEEIVIAKVGHEVLELF